MVNCIVFTCSQLFLDLFFLLLLFFFVQKIWKIRPLSHTFKVCLSFALPCNEFLFVNEIICLIVHQQAVRPATKFKNCVNYETENQPHFKNYQLKLILVRMNYVIKTAADVLCDVMIIVSCVSLGWLFSLFSLSLYLSVTLFVYMPRIQMFYCRNLMFRQLITDEKFHFFYILLSFCFSRVPKL